MSLLHDNSTGGATAPTGSSLTYAHTVGSLIRGCLFVGFGYFNNALSASAVSYGGVAMTKRRRYENGSAFATTELWFLPAPAAGSNNVVITLSGSSIIVGGAVSLSGVDQTTPIEADNGGKVVTGTHTSHSDSVTTVTDDAWLLDILLSSSNATTAVTESGQVERIDKDNGAAVDTGSMSTRPVGAAGSYAAGWSFPSTGFATNQIICAVRPHVVAPLAGIIRI